MFKSNFEPNRNTRYDNGKIGEPQEVTNAIGLIVYQHEDSDKYRVNYFDPIQV